MRNLISPLVLILLFSFDVRGGILGFNNHCVVQCNTFGSASISYARNEQYSLEIFDTAGAQEARINPGESWCYDPGPRGCGTSKHTIKVLDGGFAYVAQTTVDTAKNYNCYTTTTNTKTGNKRVFSVKLTCDQVR